MALLLDALKSVDFLADAADDVVLRFMVLGKSADFAKRHVFWKAGAAPEMLVVPVSGEAKTATRSVDGREFIDRFLASGECLGLASALDGLPHPTDAEVVRAGEFFTITRANFHRFLDERPEVRAKMTEMIGALYRRNLKEREDVALRPVPQRVAEFLVGHACIRQDDGAKVLVHATQSELAARLGTVREVVARVFADFTQRGLIERGDNGIYVADWDGLHAEAGLDADDEDLADRGRGPMSPSLRTTRFFLPTIERRRRHEGVDEAAKCREHLGDLSLCRDRGCPAAADADVKRRVAK
jgi:CRP/FNR family transcriptional regulator, dissimilatory nitrate respiration regulator